MREADFHSLEQPKSVEEWIARIETVWKNIPEFKVDPGKLKHLAIICDGNRRAAKERGFHPWYGHQAGVEVIKGIARAAREWGVHALTFWTWSTENWERESEQIEFIMGLAAKGLNDKRIIEELVKNQVRFTHIGRKDRLPLGVRKALEDLELKTVDLDVYRVNLAMDYGGTDEIRRALVKMFEEIQAGKISAKQLLENKELIFQYLDTVGQSLPDLVIRTGVKPEEIPHTSGFMPLQTAYAGWAFLPDLFPDLTPQSLLKPISDFVGYERRLGR